MKRLLVATALTAIGQPAFAAPLIISLIISKVCTL